MDALRLVLIIIGVLILVGIYLYSTRKRGAHEDNINEVRIMDRPGYTQARPPSTDAESLINPDSNNLSEQLAQLGGMVSQYKAKPAPASSDVSGNDRQHTAAQTQSPADTHPQVTPEVQQEAMRAVQGLPELVVLNIMVRPGGVFHGADVLDAVQSAGLEFGDRGIFHRFTSTGGTRRPVFSLANILEPGSFDFEDMAAFSTVGLTLFMQLPALADSVHSYEEMLGTAQAIADALKGDVYDERRSILTLQAIEHTREQLREFTYKLMVARKRAELER